MSLNSSPVKPLNFLTMKVETGSADNLAIKEFNSSSDTYTSETEIIKDNRVKLEQPETLYSSHNGSREGDDFLFATPMTSTVNLHNQETKSTVSSPGKSIMKKTPGNSPKKSVVFTNSNPEIHLYENNNGDEIGEKKVVENVIESEWNELNQESDEEVLTPAAIPPPPPPHKSSNFMSFLTMSTHNDDINLETLQSLKSKSKNFSNLSLNEKLDMYLSNNQKEHDLDDHLNDLNNAIKSKTESNIHALYLDLQNVSKEKEDDPLESLTKDTEVQIRSAGSSQSSLQSLVNDNRLLNSVNIPILNKGTKVINGIRGIDDDIVASIIPKTNENLSAEEDNGGYDPTDNENSIEREPYMTLGAQSSSDDEKFHDSFNTTNTNTEKSIMNLLMSSSNDLHTSQEHRTNKSIYTADNKSINSEHSNEIPIGEDVESGNTKREVICNNQDGDEIIKQEEVENDLSDRKIKSEYNQTNSNENNNIVKDEETETIPYHHDQTSINGELDAANNHMDYYEGMKLELVSGFGKASAGNDIKLVKTYYNGRNAFIGNESEDEDNKASQEQINETDTSDIGNNSAQVSLRFHMDSDWKLEDSNDGDREDNDDYTQNELTTINHNNVKQKPEALDQEESHLDTKIRDDSESMKSDTSSSVEYRDASDVTSHRSLAPPRLPMNESDQSKEDNEESDILDDGIALANSSNIAPPEELTLPVIDANNYSSFEDLTKNINISGSSFEESLSAEHDPVKAPLNYISIWHSQNSQKRHPKESLQHKAQIMKNIQTLDNDKRLTPRILSEMNKRKFKEINVTSRRIVSPGTEDFNVSAFLPELSDDSGFENHFKFLKNNASVFNYSNLSQGKETHVNTKNILSNIHESKVLDNDNSETYKEQQKRRSLRPINHENNLVAKNKTSKFRVPSFEIQRSNSILSPKNKYDDIFEDVLKDKPTIVSKGMKTLPSMDRNDVQRILNTKKVITQDDFVNLKLGNQSKYSVIEGTFDKYNDLQQHASIHNASPESTAIDDGVLPHLANELLKSPGTLLAKDQFFNKNNFSNERAAVGNNSEESPNLTIDVQKNEHIPINSYFPDPDPELVCSPVKHNHDEITEQDAQNRINPNNPFLVLTNNHGNNSEETITKFDIASPSTPEVIGDMFNDPKIASSGFNTPVSVIPSNQGTPAQKKSPIKIGSPIKLIKEGSKVTGVTTVQTPTKKLDQENLGRVELNNQKLRNSPTKPQEVVRKLSTVSVPSIYTNKSLQSGKNMSPMDEVKNSSGIIQEGPDVTQIPRERGKLFVKVNGIKNIGLPDIPSHNAEFSLTLDNGVHCIKTPNYKMSKNVHIGKEFELTVGKSLEFIITLKAAYDKPGNKLVEVKERRLVKSKNRISRLFGSKDIVTTTKFVPQEVKDTWKHKFAQDGSFARCYIDLNQFEEKINCRAINFDLNCFNEWEVLQTSDGKLTKNKPYRIGQLEVTMLYIPRSDEKEVLPTSIRLAYDITQETKQSINTKFEGYLHQEGGDCEVWKRRFFKLEGTSLIAHSEFSHKTRAKINLAKITEVLYFDEENITKPSNKQRNFSDLLLVQHSFKIKFANGEVIDFSAPNKDEKLHWISLLENIIRRNRLRQQPWVNLMLSKQITQQIQY